MSLQTQYPNAIWFDSAHTGTESGTFLEPYSSSINTAFNASTETAPVIIFKAGTHTLEDGGTFTYTEYAGGVTIIGDGDVTLESGATAINNYAFLHSAVGTYTFKNIKFLNNTTGAAGVQRGFIGKQTTFNLVLENCSYDIVSSAPQRSVFHGGTVTARNSTFHSYVLTITSQQHLFTFSTVNLENCTLYNVKNSFSGSIPSSSDQTFILKNTNSTIKNTIFYAAGSTNTTTGLANSNFGNKTFTNCCVYSPDSFLDDFTASEDSGTPVLADPQFVDSANSDFRLRPSSPCINAGTAS